MFLNPQVLCQWPNCNTAWILWCQSLGQFYQRHHWLPRYQWAVGTRCWPVDWGDLQYVWRRSSTSFRHLCSRIHVSYAYNKNCLWSNIIVALKSYPITTSLGNTFHIPFLLREVRDTHVHKWSILQYADMQQRPLHSAWSCASSDMLYTHIEYTVFIPPLTPIHSDEVLHMLINCSDFSAWINYSSVLSLWYPVPGGWTSWE